MKRKEFAARVWSKIKAYERRLDFIKEGDRILAAVSGGPDSVCLAHYLSTQARRRGFWLGLAHVHHGLRGKQADRDAEFVRNLGRSLNLPVQVRTVQTASHARARRKGIEGAARELRYKALLGCAKKLDCGKVATAHQMDDQAETVLLNLLRGTKLRALGGIPPRRPLSPGVEVIRPLLALKRGEVLEYLRIHGLKYRTDRSNLSMDFTRNWVRRKVITRLAERNPRIREHLAGIAEQVRAIDKNLKTGYT